MKKLLLVASTVAMFSTNIMASDGQAIFDKACKTCHAAGVANAPKPGDKAKWDPLLAKGMDTLIASVKNGLNAMPPKGMCNDCSDADYKAAIEFMVK